MALNSKLLCTGDPILDIYVSAEGHVIRRRGGAENIYSNILSLLLNYPDLTPDSLKFVHPAPPLGGRFSTTLITDIDRIYTIVRAEPYDQDIHLTPKKYKDIFYCSDEHIFSQIVKHKPDILVLGDYNKGALNATAIPDKKIAKAPKVEIAIVDSRYRSLDPFWLSFSKLKIWHASGEEYDKKWAEQFDYVFHTDASNPVRIYKGNSLIGEAEVPKGTKVVNTCGAGDTFTAALAAKFFHSKNLDNIRMIKIAKFAIAACQEVVSMPYTATTKFRIK